MAELLRMPEIAANTTEAVLSSWPLPENTAFARDDVIATVETAKAVVDVAAEADGVLLKLLVPPGAEVAVGDAIALIGAPGETVTDVDAVLAGLGVAAAVPPGAPAPAPAAPTADPLDTPEAAPSESTAPAVAAPSVTASAASAAPGNGRVFASPLARRLARERGLSLAEIEGSGPNGRVVRRDVERAVAAPGGQTDADVAWTEVPHTRLRRLVAARLTESKTTAPHFYLRATARVDRLLDLRAELNEGRATRISVNDLVVKAVAHAHVAVPALNVTWGPEAVRTYSTVDVAVAVATDTGLVTPVLRGVERLSISAVSAAVREVAARAASGRLQQHELEGGTITVTNLGMYGIEEFAAIINPPQAGILAVGAVTSRPVQQDDGSVGFGMFLTVVLSADHRPVDGALAARWLSAFRELVENPMRLLV